MRSHLGSIIGTVVTFRDITERSRAEARIREQADLLDHAHDAIIVRDTYTRKISFWNHGAESVYGWTAAEAVGCDIGKLIFTDPGALDAVTAQLLKTGEWRGEHHHVSKAGKELNISGRVTLLRDASGNPKSALVINTDITEQKKLEQQFLRAQRMESIGTLASGVAHDLNNILSPIMMSVSMLRDELPLDLRDRIISTIEKSAQRGADIVKQVVSFARGVEGERMLVQPIHLIKEVAEFAQQMFPKSIVVRPRYSDRIWVVEGDPTQLHQVLLNLCVNARDAMPNGGKLTIALENFTVDEQYAGMMPGSQPGPYVIITVSDTGVGIPSELIDKIFDPFFTTKELGKGTGLGLSTVVGIVKNHGGFVTVDSVEGRGTTFKVFLPANSSAVTTGPATEAMPLPPGHGEMVLVVDDEQSILLITQTMLEKHGYRVVTAADGTGALTLFAQQMNEIDVVLTDVSMPFMDGTGLARVLKRMSPLTPMIACSGQREEAHEAELKDLGVKVFLRKPYNTVELLTALRSVLDNHAGDQK
jgi:PAS domain S-box-containing protein